MTNLRLWSLGRSHDKATWAVRQWFFFFWFGLHYPKILRAQPKIIEDCWSRLGLFTYPKILRAQPKMLEDCRSRRDSPKISNAIRTPNRYRVAKQRHHHHESLQIMAESRSNCKCEWGLSVVRRWETCTRLILLNISLRDILTAVK